MKIYSLFYSCKQSSITIPISFSAKPDVKELSYKNLESKSQQNYGGAVNSGRCERTKL